MVPFQIGNWLITAEGIEWTGGNGGNLLIPRQRIAEPGPPDRNHMYDWLVHLPTKPFLIEQDIFTLNTAIIYALEEYDIGFPAELSFVETFIEQQKELADKEENGEEEVEL